MTGRPTMRPLFGPSIVWERPPLPQGTGLSGALPAAVRRELAILSARLGPEVEVWRLAAAAGRGRGRVGAMVVGALRQGAVVRRPGPRAPLAETCLVAGVDVPRRLRWTSGGGVLAFTRTVSGREPVVLRLVPRGDGACDPSPADAWGEVDEVPRVHGRGTRRGLVWSLEERLPGAPPRRVDPDTVRSVAAVLARLPVPDSAPSDLVADLQATAAAVPAFADELRHAVDRWSAAGPGRARHGDLWVGNLLMTGGRVTGLVDWDAARTSGTPLADLVQLIARRPRRRGRPGLGPAWAEASWREPRWRDALVEAAAIMGVPAAPLDVDRAAVAWWAGEVAGTLRRAPHRASDRRWLARHVRPVLADLGAGG